MFIDANFLTITKFNHASFDELTATIISTLSGILLNFDISGAKFALPDDEWNIQPENVLVGPPPDVRPRPNPPIAGIPAGPPPVLPIGALNEADINLANMQLNYHNAATIIIEKKNQTYSVSNTQRFFSTPKQPSSVEFLQLIKKRTRFSSTAES